MLKTSASLRDLCACGVESDLLYAQDGMTINTRFT